MDSSLQPLVKLIVTAFHKPKVFKPHSKAPETTNPSSFLSDLSAIYTHLHIPQPPLPTFSSPQTPAITRHLLPTHQPPGLDTSTIRHSPPVTALETAHSVELIFDLCRPTPSGTRPLKLALFDMDSTLINEEVIDELARSIGISDAVSAITARAMNGDIDFATSLKERVGMLKGVPLTVWEELKRTVTVAEGAEELIAGLRRRGVFTGVVSGGFTPMAEWLKDELGLNVAVANHLVESPATEEIPFPHLSGELNPDFPIVTPELKRSTLLKLSTERSIPLSETLAVGDGSNDLLMLGAAGLGIAWRAKEKVQVAAPMRLNGKSLADLLFLLGPEDAELSNGIEGEGR